MKKLLKKIWKILSWPPLGITALLISLMLIFLFESSVVDFDTSLINDISDIHCIHFNDNGLMAGVNDNIVYVFDAENDLPIYDIDSKDFRLSNKVFNVNDLYLDEFNNLYVLYTVNIKNSFALEYEAIAKFDENGKFVKNIIQYDYSADSDYLNIKGNIFGLNVSNEKLSYIYVDSDLVNHMVSVSVQNSVGEDLILEKITDNNVITYAKKYSSDEYSVILSNGDICIVSPDSLKSLAETYDFSFYENGELNSFHPSELYVNSGHVFCRSHNSLLIYEIINDNLSNALTLALDGNESAYEAGYEETDDYNAYFFEAPSFSSSFIGISLNGEIYYDLNTYDNLIAIYFNSFGHNLISVLIIVLKILTPFLLIYGIFMCFGNFVGWKFSILAKQLLTTIPLVTVSFAVIFVIFIYYFVDVSYSDKEETMKVFTKVCSSLFDGDEIASIDNQKEFVDSGMYYDYVRKLKQYVSENKTEWSGKFTASVYLINLDEDDYMNFKCLASSEGYSAPYSADFYMEDGYDELIDKDNGNLFVVSYLSTGEMYYTSDSAIYDSDGNLVAVFELSTDTDEIDNQVENLVLIVFYIICSLLLILIVAVSLLSKFNVRKIQIASDAVSNIAKGDFSSRIDKTGKDELGQICQNVNDMAGKLDELFKEKDENEQFYYKFVPEQFKELLHKDKFTDLSLGDAESINLTVLFCDIRSFSLNSEMMTAKENFEFINIIYGIAGPIIRKHNGFVDKYIGDAVMALFENADDAIKCGKELYQKIVLNYETAKSLNVSSINIGIGIHTGMARIGIVGEQERMSGTVISNTVNMSSRLESLTKQYDTAMIITKDTLDSMSNPDELNLRYLGMIQVAGVNEVKALYEVLDCLDEDRYVERFKNKADFREAVRLYHLGELKKSLGMFKSIKNNTEKDPCIDTYIDYIEKMIKEDNKDHLVFKFSRK